MSIERRRNTEKRSVRTLIVISRLKQDGQDGQDGQDEGAIAGDRPPHYEKKTHLPAPVARGPVPRMHSV